jgi:hypothetical protein
VYGIGTSASQVIDCALVLIPEVRASISLKSLCPSCFVLAATIKVSIFPLDLVVWIVAGTHPGIVLELSDQKTQEFLVQIALPW